MLNAVGIPYIVFSWNALEMFAYLCDTHCAHKNFRFPANEFFFFYDEKC